MPPATTMPLSPKMIDCAPNIADFIPEAHTLLTVVQQTFLGKLAKIAAWRAGACPRFAEQTLPINTSSMAAVVSEGIFATTALIAVAPKWVAGILLKVPPKLPSGVLAADMINTFFIIFCFVHLIYELVEKMVHKVKKKLWKVVFL